MTHILLFGILEYLKKIVHRCSQRGRHKFFRLNTWFFQVWTTKAACTSQYKDSIAKSMQQVDAILRLIDKYKNDMKLVTSSSGKNYQ